MTPKRKKIYIAVIIACFASTGGVLYYGFFSTPTAAPPDVNTILHQTQNDANATGTATAPAAVNSGLNGNSAFFSAPAVFPQDTKFDWSLLDSAQFKELHGIPNLELGPVGRANPFSP